MIDTSLVSLTEIEKISTKKSWSQGVGGILLAAGVGLAIADLSTSSEESIPDIRGAMSILGLILIIPGAIMVPPYYHQLGKSEWLVVSKGQPAALE
jgi:CDP-diglyceride synthetase